MKVYLAAPYGQKSELNTYAEQLRVDGIEVTSSWLEEPHSPTTKMADLPDEQHTFYALNDLADVDRADTLVFFSFDSTTPMPRGGRHVEFGYAIAKGLRILVVGPKENIFHYLPKMRHVDTWIEAKESLNHVKDGESWGN